MKVNLATRFRVAYWALVHNLDTMRLHIWEKQGLTLPQLRILFMIHSHPDATTNLLAKLLGLTPPTVSGLVDKLVRAGLIERGHHPHDRRIIPLALTADGQAIVGEIAQDSQAYFGSLAADIGDDLEPMIAVLEQLVSAIERRPAMRAAEKDALIS